MAFIEDVTQIIESNDFKKESFTLLENILKAATGDKFAAKDAIISILSSPMKIRDILFWEKYTSFLNGVFIEDDDIIKLSACFADNEEKEEYARRVIKIIEDIDTKNKTKYIVNLTRALLMGFVEKEDYYRLCNTIKNTLQEDLQYVHEHIEDISLKNKMQVEYLKQNGLAEQIELLDENSFQLTDLARALDKYALDYGNTDKYSYSNNEGKLSDGKMKSMNIKVDAGEF